MRAARHVDDRAAVEEARHRFRGERRRHHDDAQIVARRPGLPRERQPEIGVDGSLVELVEHDRADAGDQRIVDQARGEDAFGGEQDARRRREPALEAHVPADLLAERPAALLGDPARDGPRRDPPRLQHQHRPVGGERRRQPRGLAGAGRRDDDRGAVPAHGIDDGVDVRVDRERIQAHGTSERVQLEAQSRRGFRHAHVVSGQLQALPLTGEKRQRGQM